MQLLNDILNLVTLPLAIYGAYVLLGLPKTDAISALGRKAAAWLASKFQA